MSDYSYFGFTDPVKGYRYRLELDGYSGSLSYLTALADLRAYLFVKPLTFAFRALHIGRWLGDSDSPYLNDYYLGDPDLVRGYEYSSIIANEGASSISGDIPQIDRLLGSRIARLQPGSAASRPGNHGARHHQLPLPAHLPGGLPGRRPCVVRHPAAGVSSSLDPSAHVPVFSAGAAVRFNLLGAAVLQVYWAWPFQRPDIGGSWGLLIETGW